MGVTPLCNTVTESSANKGGENTENVQKYRMVAPNIAMELLDPTHVEILTKP